MTTHCDRTRGGRPQVDTEQAERFLNALDPARQCTFQTFDDDDDRKSPDLVALFHGTFKKRQGQLTVLNNRGAGAFCTINETDCKGRKAKNIVRIRAVFVDLDGSPLEPVLECGIEPHIVVESSPGKFHGYWLVDDCPLDTFKPVQQALAAKFQGDPSVCDLPRVMRLPGFVHQKHDPFRTRIVSIRDDSQPYHIQEIIDRIGLDIGVTANRGAPTPGDGAAKTDLTLVLDGVLDGERDVKVFKYSCSLRARGVRRKEVEALVSLAAGRCEPPLSEDRWRKKIDQAWKYPDGREGIESAQENVKALLADPAKLRETAFEPDAIGALAVVQREDPGQWAQVKKAAKGYIKEIERAIKKSRLSVVPSSDQPSIESNPDAQTLRSVISTAIAQYQEMRCSPDYAQISELAYDWFTSQGTRFYRTPASEPFMSWDGHLYWLNSSDKNRKAEFEALLFKLAGIMQTSREGKSITEGLRLLCVTRGKTQGEMSWLHTDLSTPAVYMNLNNAENEIARISPDGVEILSNADNDYGVLLAGSEKMRPITYVPDFSAEEGAVLAETCIQKNLTCHPVDANMILLWAAVMLLMDFSSTWPLLRLEGDPSSGKTGATDVLSTFVFGEPLHTKPTVAALYADATRNPVQFIDNLERDDLTPDMIDFLLLIATRGAREKRAGSTDSGVVTERPHTLVLTNGIDPLGAELTEISSRTLTMQFSQNYFRPGFVGTTVIEHIKAHRNELWSWFFRATAATLKLIRDGGLERAKGLLDTELGHHNKSRCHDYFALMYLFSISDGAVQEIEEKLSCLDTGFRTWVLSQSADAVDTGAVANTIANVLSSIFYQRRRAGVEGDTALVAFRNKYPLEITDDTIHNALSRDLFAACRLAAKDRALLFPIKDPVQLGKRLQSGRIAIEAAGFHVEVTKGRANIQRYTITKGEPGGDGSEKDKDDTDLTLNLNQNPNHEESQCQSR